MSVIDEGGGKLVLERVVADTFWDLVRDRYADDDPATWKRFAMLALRENAGWTLADIGRVFGHTTGHVTRCVSRTKAELRRVLDSSPDLLGLDATDELAHETEDEG